MIFKMNNLSLSWKLLLLLSVFATVQPWRSVRQRRDAIYNDLLKLNANCPGLDTCQGSTAIRDLKKTNCHCDPVCNILNTCCADSPYRHRPKQQILGYLDCKQPYGATSESVYLVTGCSPTWRGERSVRQSCDADFVSLKDPFLMVPVTDKRTGISYKNYYCYVCNGLEERRNPIFFWEVKLFSDPEMNDNTGPELFRRIQSGRIAAKDYIFDDHYFYRSVEVPERFRYRVRLCRDMVDTCFSDWTDAETKKKCESYAAVVLKKANNRYKNPHCAICNHVEISDLECSDTDVYVARGPPYGYLFVGLLSMEDKVQRCPRNNVFDTFSNKCRPVRCGAGRTMVEGECVPNARNRNTPENPRRVVTNPRSRSQSWLVVG